MPQAAPEMLALTWAALHVDVLHVQLTAAGLSNLETLAAACSVG